MIYDIAVIGGGPAGMMAAGRAGELGAKVILLEKNSKLGIKLLATGGGRANITNYKSYRELADSYGAQGRWLIPGLSKFGPEEVIEFFNSRGLATKVEEEDRVFPASDQARDVLRVLINYLQTSQVEVKTGAEVIRLVKQEDKITKIILSTGEEIVADKYIICSGGKSYPQTGSTGAAYKWLKQLGHHIVNPKPSLTPIIVKDKFIKDLEGLSLKEVGISCFQNNKKFCSTNGSAIFTANGLSGPAILNISHEIGQKELHDIQIKLDFFPELDFSSLDKKLQELFNSSHQMLKNSLNQIMAPRLAELLISLSGFNPQKILNSINKEERKQLVHLFKEFSLTFFGLAGFEKAMVTAGGVGLQEVNSHTMQSKIIDNLFLAGEILDLAGPTGGYNLQICWTSGHLAGEKAYLASK